MSDKELLERAQDMLKDLAPKWRIQVWGFSEAAIYDEENNILTTGSADFLCGYLEGRAAALGRTLE